MFQVTKSSLVCTGFSNNLKVDLFSKLKTSNGRSFTSRLWMLDSVRNRIEAATSSFERASPTDGKEVINKCDWKNLISASTILIPIWGKITNKRMLILLDTSTINSKKCGTIELRKQHHELAAWIASPLVSTSGISSDIHQDLKPE